MSDHEPRHVRIDALQVLRACAFLGIFTSHCGLSSLGGWGVSLFFVLSGFLMVYNYYDRPIVLHPKAAMSFAFKKIRKLYSLHILCMIATLMIPVVFNGYSLLVACRKSLKDILLNAFLIQSWIPLRKHYFSLNGVAWYLSDITFIYLFTPLFLAFIKRLTTKSSAIKCGIAIYVIQCVMGFISQFVHVPNDFSDDFIKYITYICPLYRMGDYCSGGILGYLYLKNEIKLCEKNWKTAPWIATPIELLAISVLILTIEVYHGRINPLINWNWFRTTCLYLPSSLLLVWVFALNKGVITRALTGKLLIYFGNLSSYMFLIHLVVIRYLQRIYMVLYQNEINTWVLGACAILITILLAESYRRCHRNMLSRIYAERQEQ